MRLLLSQAILMAHKCSSMNQGVSSGHSLLHIKMNILFYSSNCSRPPWTAALSNRSGVFQLFCSSAHCMLFMSVKNVPRLYGEISPRAGLLRQASGQLDQRQRRIKKTLWCKTVLISLEVACASICSAGRSALSTSGPCIALMQVL